MFFYKLKFLLCLILIKLTLTNNQQIKNNPQVTEIQEEIDYDDHNETLLIKNLTTIPSSYESTKINFTYDNDNNFKPSLLIDNEKTIYKNSGYSLEIPSLLNSDSNIINNNNYDNAINKGIVTFPTSNNQPTKTSNNIYHVDGQYRVNTLHKNTDLNDGYLTIEIPSSSSIKQQQSPYYFTPNNNNAFKNHPTINPYYQLPIVQQNDDVPVVNYQQHYELITPEYYQQNNQLPQYDNQQHYLQQQEKHHHPHHHEQVDINNDKPTEMLYVSSHRETSLTKTRKFPYKYYQPNDDTGIHFIEEGHAFVPRDRQISPWQKLIHLAWAVLPLGLLFAALKTPSRIDRNTTQPNILLSKWRDGEDLPVEHKKKIDEICDDIKLCEAIVHGSDKNSEIVYNILWNFATKSTNEEARKNGLEEIFQAVKKKNCKIITC